MAYLQNRPNDTLWHYTTEAGFLGILRAKKLWFSDLAMTNDPRELNIGYQAFVDALDSVRRKDFPGDNGKFLDHLAHLLGSHRAHSHAFCACFAVTR